MRISILSLEMLAFSPPSLNLPLVYRVYDATKKFSLHKVWQYSYGGKFQVAQKLWRGHVWLTFTTTDAAMLLPQALLAAWQRLTEIHE